LNNIFFEYAKADLKPESYPELMRVVKFMNDNPLVAIEIGGHTDSIGNAQSNLALSKARAESVEQYIVKAGVPESRVTAKGYGKSRPLASNSNEEGRQQNRRVEFTILRD
jgi:OOP family OmpA-OmpF porin